MRISLGLLRMLAAFGDIEAARTANRLKMNVLNTAVYDGKIDMFKIVKHASDVTKEITIPTIDVK